MPLSVISLNGTRIIGPKDFNQKVYTLEKPVELLAENSLTVELRSKPEGFLTIEIIAYNVNTPPIANAGPDQTVFVGNTVQLDGSSSNDADGDIISYDWSFISLPPASSTVLSGQNEVNPFFLADVHGEYVAQLVVNDGKADSAPDTVKISTLNSKPVADAGDDQTVYVTQTVTLDSNGSTDIDGDPLTRLWSFIALPVGSGATLSDPTAVRPFFVADLPGTYSVQLIVNDGMEDSDPDSVTISTTNSPPVANAGPDQTAYVGDTVHLDGSASGDADNDVLLFNWSLVARPADSGTTIADPNAIKPTFLVDEFGTYVAQLIVHDGTVDSAPDTVTISTENSKPVADAGPDKIVSLGSTVTLDGSRSHDVDDDALSFWWSFTTIPMESGAAISDHTTVLPSFMADKEGLYVSQLIVNDGKVDSNPDTVVIEARNNPPHITSQAINVATQGMVYSYDVEAVDPDAGDVLTFSLDISPSGMTINGATGLIQWTPTNAQVGAYAVTVRVTDSGGLSARQNFTVTVPNVNNAPIITSRPVTAAAEGQLYTYDVEATDPDTGDVLTFSLDVSPSEMTIDPSTGLINWTPSFTDVGSHDVEVKVEDGGGGEATQAFAIEVADVNRAPEIISSPVTSANEGALYEYDVEALDADGDVIAFNLITAPDGMTINPTSGLITWSPDFDDVGEHSVGIEGSDGKGGNTAQLFTIMVVNFNRNPMITSLPLTGVRAGSLYQYDVEAVDPDGDILHFSLTQAPEYMTIDPSTGLINWTPGATDEGNQRVEVKVSDGLGGEARDSFTINVELWDLKIEDVQGGCLRYDGQALTVVGTISANIINTGHFDIDDPSDVVFFEDTNYDGAFNAAEDNVLGQTVVPGPLKQGESAIVWADIAGSVRFNRNIIWAITDSANIVAEVDEINNLAQTGEGCRYFAGKIDPVLEWSKQTFSVAAAANDVFMTPVVVDLNNDGVSDIIFNTWDYSYQWRINTFALRAISGDGGEELWSVTDPNLVNTQDTGLAAGDIDADGYPEIIAVYGYGPGPGTVLTAFEHDGSLKWKSEGKLVLPGEQRIDGGAPSIADLDHDGIPEIIFGAKVFNADGTLRWSGHDAGGMGRGSANFGPLSIVADLDLDGNPEVVAGKSAYHADGTLYWNAGIPDGCPAVGNFDNDPFPEIVVVVSPNVYLLEHYGIVKWGPVPIAGVTTVPYAYAGGPPVVADLDGDTWPEIGVAGASKYTVFESDGSIKWTADTYETGSGVTGASVYDLDGDGAIEVIYGDQTALWIFRGADGAVLFKFLKSSGTVYEYPIVADIDGDGEAEIIAPAGDYNYGPQTGIFVFGSASGKWTETRGVWNQHTYHITNVTDTSGIPAFEENSWQRECLYRGNVSNIPEADSSPAPNLTVSYLRKGAASTETTYTVRIGNGGAQSAPAGISVALFDGNPHGDAVNIGGTTTSNVLAPGQFEDVSIVFPLDTFPDEPSARMRWVWVDTDQVLNESNEIDNYYQGKINQPPVINSSPVISSSPNTTGTASALYEYDVHATDPDGDELTYNLTTAPSGMTIDPASGLIQWTPILVQVGNQSVQVRVTDGKGGEALQSFVIVVVGQNGLPVITTAALPSAVAGAPYAYTIEASDPDGDSLGFSLLSAPAGLTIHPATGTLSWTAGTGDAGDHPLVVQVEDGRGGVVTRTYTLSVAGLDIEPPVVTLTITPPEITLGQAVAVQITAHDNVDVVARAVTMNGVAVPIDANGFVQGDILAAGLYRFEATATDAAGNAGAASGTLTVRDPADQQVPTVAITAPAPESEVTGPVTITGTASDATLVEYVLDYALKGEATYTQFARGTASVVNGALGIFDPTVMMNGLYEVRLTARDSNNHVSATTTSYRVTGEQKVGNFTVAFQDVSVPSLCLPVTVTRVYDSCDKAKGDFGVGWRLDVQTMRVQESRTQGTEWAMDFIYESGPFGIQIPTWVLYDTASHLVSLRLPDGRLEEFDLVVSPTRNQFEPIMEVSVGYTPRPGTVGSLAATGTPATLLLTGTEGPLELFDVDEGVFDPRTFAYTAPDGTVYNLDKYDGLQSVQCVSGSTLTFGPGGITHDSGTGVGFTRDAQDRITSLTDPNGNVHQYSYDARSDLVAYIDPEGNVTRYTYNASHGLLEIKDPRGVQAIRNEYDADGRLIGHTDAAGQEVTYVHDLAARRETVTDRLGNATVHEYDGRGNVIRTIDALGGETIRTYDSFGNELTRTDPLGQTTSMEYDSRRNITLETDPLGNETRYAYTSLNAVRTITDPLNRVTTNTYNAFGDLTETRDALGNVTTFVHDSGAIPQFYRPFLRARVDALGNRTSYEYDARGNVTKETDPLGNAVTSTYDANGNRLTESRTRTLSDGTKETLVTSFAYDAMNRLVQTTHPDGSTTRTTYNELGKQTETIDQLGRKTSFAYDALGQLVKTTYPDNTSESSTYDAEGRRLTSIDRAGRVTSFTYDALGRMIATTFPDGASTSTAYDAKGQVVATTDARGNVTRYEYDAAGRRTKVIDALGNATTFAFDAAGNQTQMTDANGNTVRFEYDANNRRLKTIYPDNTFDLVGYDALGRSIVKTDQSGKTTQFEYDALGRLTAVIDALDQRAEYVYDEQGNMTMQRDANGRETLFEYDILNRKTATILPLGQRSVVAYDPVGNVIATTDFNGDTITLEYDSTNRLINKNLPDHSSVAFTYTPTGQRQNVTDNRRVTTFEYDSRDRLLSRTDPDGTAISYTYDETGNRTSVTAPSGTVYYTFDAQNRPATVTDTDGGITSYTYNSIGNLVRTDLPNGTFETRSYNTVNRLVNLENRSSAGIISGYQYTLDAKGNRTAVLENTGRLVEYAYDDLGRLASETITDTVNDNRIISYSFDAVGNRLNRDDSTEGTTTYVYDDNDRLLSETLDGQTTTYTYDNNGNTLSRVAGLADSADYTWNVENRLVAADLTNEAGTKQIDYQYDADGIRVTSIVNGDETRYLIDASHPYQQVLEEYSPGNVIRISYVHGNDLISQKRGMDRSFYYVDGLGSARNLTDTEAQVTDNYLYDAYGRIVSQNGGTVNSYLFAGEQRDLNIGMDYLRARYMDPRIGRFCNRDVSEGVLIQPTSLHKYNYGNANPLTNVDPSGRFSISLAISLDVLMSQVTFQEMLRRESPKLIKGVLVMGGLVLTRPAFEARELGIRLVAHGAVSRGVAIYNKANELISCAMQLTKGAADVSDYFFTAKDMVKLATPPPLIQIGSQLTITQVRYLQQMHQASADFDVYYTMNYTQVTNLRLTPVLARDITNHLSPFLSLAIKGVHELVKFFSY